MPLDFEGKRLKGTTPTGEDFSVAVTMGGEQKAQWCNAAEAEAIAKAEEMTGVGAAILVHTCTIKLGDTAKKRSRARCSELHAVAANEASSG